MRKKRKLVSLGIFSRRSWDGSRLSDPRMIEIYDELLQLGFRKTRWQYIFEHQLVGLVLPYNDGKNEVHVRFYRDRIFAEFEVGRSTLAHFLGPFQNANAYILKVLRNRLSPSTYSYLEEMASAHRFYQEEHLLQNWRFDDVDFEKARDRAGRQFVLEYNQAKHIAFLLSWRSLACLLGGTLAFVLAREYGIYSGVLFAFLIPAFLKLLPKVGRP